MHTVPPDDERAEAAVLQAMVLFSTLSTAADVWQAAKERRAGHDPSAQEAPAFVRPFLRLATGELQAQWMQLQASLVYEMEHEDARPAMLVRRYSDLMTLRGAVNLLQVVHQRLLSLYPDVEEALVEETRRLYVYGTELLEVDADEFLEALQPLVRRGLLLCRRLNEALRSGA